MLAILGPFKETCTWFVISGEYAGFDDSQPTAESGGKGRVINMLKEQYGFKTVVMIGDGATDLEACPPAVSVLSDCALMHLCFSYNQLRNTFAVFAFQSVFIGFGGNVVRPQVKERSLWYVTSFGELLKELEKI
jgi:phosphoserine phosphatase